MRVEVFKYTSDDWCPSYKLVNPCWNEGENLKLVRVSFTQTGPNPPSDGEWRVCAWGDDDCGMERDFTDEMAAFCCFLEVIGLYDVSMDALRERGFVSA